MQGKFQKQQGVGIVEVIVALALISAVFFSVSTVMQFSIRTHRMLAMRQTASLLADEGLEVVRFERDSSLVTLWARPVDTDLFVEFSGMNAQLTETDPGPINGIYTRVIRLEQVYRDMAGDIAAMGTEDTNARRVTVTVSFTDPFSTSQSVVHTTYAMRLSQ